MGAEETNTVRSLLPLLMFAVLAGSVAWACFGDRGVLANRTLEAEVAARQTHLDERRQTIAHLRSEIVRMRQDATVQERWVRQELGYVKDGELLYLFPGDRAADFEFLQDRRLLPALETK
jgi:cell division protein FtsB